MEQGCSIKSLLYPDEKPLNNDHFLASQGLWDYKLKLTLARLQSMLQEDSSAEKVCEINTHWISSYLSSMISIHNGFLQGGMTHMPFHLSIAELVGILRRSISTICFEFLKRLPDENYFKFWKNR